MLAMAGVVPRKCGPLTPQQRKDLAFEHLVAVSGVMAAASWAPPSGCPIWPGKYEGKFSGSAAELVAEGFVGLHRDYRIRV